MPSKADLPKDVSGHPIQRGQGIPIATPNAFRLGSATDYLDVFDLTPSKFQKRSFDGIMIHNPSSGSRIILSLGGASDTDEDIIVRPQSTVTLEGMMFGPLTVDEVKDKRVTHVRAILDVAQGTPASATIDYSGSGQPSDQETVDINGLTYEFSDDQSKDPANDVLVNIGASADDSWTNLVNAIIANDRDITSSIDTGTDIVTLTAIRGGTYGNGLTVADGSNPTGATFSGNLTGGVGGVGAIIHIW